MESSLINYFNNLTNLIKNQFNNGNNYEFCFKKLSKL